MHPIGAVLTFVVPEPILSEIYHSNTLSEAYLNRQLSCYFEEMEIDRGRGREGRGTSRSKVHRTVAVQINGTGYRERQRTAQSRRTAGGAAGNATTGRGKGAGERESKQGLTNCQGAARSNREDLNARF